MLSIESAISDEATNYHRRTRHRKRERRHSASQSLSTASEWDEAIHVLQSRSRRYSTYTTPFRPQVMPAPPADHLPQPDVHEPSRTYPIHSRSAPSSPHGSQLPHHRPRSKSSVHYGFDTIYIVDPPEDLPSPHRRLYTPPRIKVARPLKGILKKPTAHFPEFTGASRIGGQTHKNEDVNDGKRHRMPDLSRTPRSSTDPH